MPNVMIIPETDCFMTMFSKLKGVKYTCGKSGNRLNEAEAVSLNRKINAV